jgi:hypothetical protein
VNAKLRVEALVSVWRWFSRRVELLNIPYYKDLKYTLIKLDRIANLF